MTSADWAQLQSEAEGACQALGAAIAPEEAQAEAAADAAFALATAASLGPVPPLLRLGNAVRAALRHGLSPQALALLRQAHAALVETMQQQLALPPGAAFLAPDRAGRPAGSGAAFLAPDRAGRPAGSGAVYEPATLLDLCIRLESAACGVHKEQAPPGRPGDRGLGTGAGPGDGPEGPETFTPLCEEDLVEPFIEETGERLEALGQKLVHLEQRPQDRELINDIFRDLHTIKGAAGFAGLRRLNRLAHAAEDLVGELRQGSRQVTRPTIDALLLALDGLRLILDQAVRHVPIDVDLRPYLRALRAPADGDPPPDSAADAGAAALPAPAASPPIETAGPAAPQPPAPAASGARVREGEGGARHTLRVDFDKLDLLLNLVGELVMSKGRLQSRIQALSGLSRDLQGRLRRARRAEKAEGAFQEVLGIVPVLDQVAADLGDGAAHLSHTAAELRDQVMNLRMVPVGRVLQKHHRTVRELGHRLGRKVRLEILGADTQLDKMLVEQLDDPLLHLVRNALDHGIETPEERRAAGKDEEGRLCLQARHHGGQIVIDISDDGQGIDPERILGEALRRGLFDEAALRAMERAELLGLIFHPGFSTRTEVSEISGRGVGMDVVKQAITRLKGSIEVRSDRGRGTTFVLRLPLTLAIIQVLAVEVHREVFLLPLSAVRRSLRVNPRALSRLGDGQVLLGDLDGEVPVVDLGEVLEVGGAAEVEERLVVLVEAGGALCGLVCDRQLGKREIVIKSLGELLSEVPCVAGATLLDDRVVLLLDIAQVLSRAFAERHAPRGQRSRAPRVLVAEDSAVEREALCRLLRGHGFEVVAAADGQAAAALAARDERGFDLVSTDVNMPEVDGYQLTRLLRAQERHREVPIIMLTSRAEPLDRVRGFDAGVDEYLLKPVSPDDLLSAITRHLRPAAAPLPPEPERQGLGEGP